MGDAGFFKGTSAGQDSRFSDKEKKLLRSLHFPSEFNQKVDMKKVNKDVIKEWMSKRVVELLGFDDDVVVDYAFGMLDAPSPDPKSMQINLQGFLDKNSQVFVLELWRHLISAQDNLGGIPRQFLEDEKAKLLESQAYKAAQLTKIREQEDKERALAKEVRQKAQAIRDLNRPRASASFDSPAAQSRGGDSSHGRDPRRERSRSRDGRDSRRQPHENGNGNGRNGRRFSRDEGRGSRDYRRSGRDDYNRGSRRRSRSRSRSWTRNRDHSRDRRGNGRDHSGRDSSGRERNRSRDRRDSHDDRSKRRRRGSASRSQSRERKRSPPLKNSTRSRSRSQSGTRTPPPRSSSSSAKDHQATEPPKNGDGHNSPEKSKESSSTEVGSSSVDLKKLENELREKLLRERVMQSVKNRTTSETVADPQPME